MATTPPLFDVVPECLIETLLIVHGGADRNHPQFTQVCERWTCILAPWIRGERHVRERGGYYGQPTITEYCVYGRWNGRCCWVERTRANGIWTIGRLLSSRGTYKNGKRHGEWIYYYFKSRAIGRYVQVRGTLKNGVPEGEWRTYSEDGKLSREGIMKNGRPYGLWHLYAHDQSLFETSFFDDSGECKAVINYGNISVHAQRCPIWILETGAYNTQ